MTALGITPANGATLAADGPAQPDRATDACWLCGTVYGALRVDEKFPAGGWLCPPCAKRNPESYHPDVRAAYALVELLNLRPAWTLPAYVSVAIMVARQQHIRAWHDLGQEHRDRTDGRRFSWLRNDTPAHARAALEKAAEARFGHANTAMR